MHSALKLLFIERDSGRAAPCARVHKSTFLLRPITRLIRFHPFHSQYIFSSCQYFPHFSQKLETKPGYRGRLSIPQAQSCNRRRVPVRNSPLKGPNAGRKKTGTTLRRVHLPVEEVPGRPPVPFSTSCCKCFGTRTTKLFTCTAVCNSHMCSTTISWEPSRAAVPAGDL